MPPYAFFKKQFVPLAEAKIGVMTHAFNYGTACFEGIRGNWNPEEKQIYLFRPQEHCLRLLQSCRILKINVPYTVDEICEMSREVVERCGYQEDVYVRPLAYKSSELLGVRLHDLEDDFLIFAIPFGPYLDVDAGARCGVTAWRRIDDNMIPARAKITGVYVNSALAKTDAHDNGYDEAIMLTADGHASEGSGENLFLVMGNKLVTPSVTENILVGITRQTIITLAQAELGLETVERPVDRTELYTADECFLTGTAAHVTPVVEVDHRPVGSGIVGPVALALQRVYFDIIRGRNKKYRDWCLPAYPKLVRTP
ncbi:MAG: branched-chain amino acid transaminase [Chloroflexi bacterium]|nr:branched-chain amino acid transaminase [Chloroflexota bacterium]